MSKRSLKALTVTPKLIDQWFEQLNRRGWSHPHIKAAFRTVDPVISGVLEAKHRALGEEAVLADFPRVFNTADPEPILRPNHVSTIRAGVAADWSAKVVIPRLLDAMTKGREDAAAVRIRALAPRLRAISSLLWYGPTLDAQQLLLQAVRDQRALVSMTPAADRPVIGAVGSYVSLAMTALASYGVAQLLRFDNLDDAAWVSRMLCCGTYDANLWKHFPWLPSSVDTLIEALLAIQPGDSLELASSRYSWERQADPKPSTRRRRKAA